jgi:exodeoxyribonuclease VII small subunit
MLETPEPPGFDELIGELEQVVRRLESGQQPLEEALDLFERGIELTRDCHERLDAKDRRVIELER